MTIWTLFSHSIRSAIVITIFSQYVSRKLSKVLFCLRLKMRPRYTISTSILMLGLLRTLFLSVHISYSQVCGSNYETIFHFSSSFSMSLAASSSSKYRSITLKLCPVERLNRPFNFRSNRFGLFCIKSNSLFLLTLRSTTKKFVVIYISLIYHVFYSPIYSLRLVELHH